MMRPIPLFVFSLSFIGTGVLFTSVAAAEVKDRPAGMTSAAIPKYVVECPPGATCASQCVVDKGT